MELARQRHRSRPRLMADKGVVWDRIAARHKPQSYRYEKISPRGPSPILNSRPTNRLGHRQGAPLRFHECMDTEVMFLRLFAELWRSRIP